MSEYQEALSRLNMPERTPGITISRSQFPIPRKDTPWNYDRILKETLNTPLPKYSIPQRLFINNDGSTSYTFPLDKQFTLAKGGRKAIAIREVKLAPAASFIGDDNHYKTEYYKIAIIANITYKGKDDPSSTKKQLVFSNHRISVARELPITSIYLRIADAVAADLNKEIGVDLFSVQLNDKGPGIVLYKADYTASFDTSPVMTIKNATINQDDNVLRIPYATSRRFEYDMINKTLICPVPEDLSIEPPYNLCSTINPWSPGNIIGSLETFYPNLNKLFPYDNQQEIKLWITNRYSKAFKNDVLSGYIDLELIIDNLNNFAMDD